MKKCHLMTRVLALSFATSLLCFGDRLELYEFDDVASTDVISAVNTGLPGTMNHPAHGTNSFLTDGAGRAVYTSDGTDVFQNNDLGTSASSGKIFLRVDYNGHTLADTSDDGVFAYGLRDSTNLSQLIVRVVKPANSSNVRISISDLIDGPGNDTFSLAAADYAALSDSSGVGTILALDLDSRTYDFYTDIGLTGTFAKELSNIALGDLGGLMSVETPDQLRLAVQNLVSGDTFTVERIVCANTLSIALLGDSLAPIDQYEFDDANGTSFTDAMNSVSGAVNNLPAFGTNTFETNGVGQAVFTGSGANVFTGRTTTTVGSGEVFMRVDFAGHDLASSATQKQFGFGFGNAGTGSNSELLLRIVKTNTDSVRIQVADVDKVSGGSTTNVTTNANINYAGLLDSTGIATILAYDVTNGIYSVYTDVGFSGVFTKVLSDITLNNSASMAQIDRLRMREQNLDATDTVSVERIAYSTSIDEVLFGDALVVDAVVDELFEFDGLSGVAVESTDNTGELSTFTHPLYGTSTFETTGTGQAILSSDGSSSFQTRNLDSTVSSGKLFLRVDFAGHSFSSSASTAVFGYGFRNSSTNSQLVVRLTKFENDNGTTPENMRISVQDTDGSGTSNSTFTAVNADYAGLVDSEGIGTLLALDLSTNTYDLYTDVGLTGTYSPMIVDEPFNSGGAAAGAHLDDIDQLRFLNQFMSNGDTITVERVAIDDDLLDILGDAAVPSLSDEFTDETATFLGFSNADATNGFTICGDGITSYSSPDGSSFFRNAALAEPVPFGKVYMRVDFSEYTTIEDSFDNFQLGMRDADGDLVSFQLAAFSSGAAKRLRTVTTVSNVGIDFMNVFSVPGLADAFAPSAILEIDIDADTYSAWMEAPNGMWLCAVGPAPLQDGAMAPVDIGPITEIRLGIQSMETTDVIGIDYVGISTGFGPLSTFVPTNPIISKGGDIVVSDAKVIGGNFVASFTSSTNVDIYSSSNLQNFGANLVQSDVSPGVDVVFEAVVSSENYYILVPTGSPAP